MTIELYSEDRNNADFVKTLQELVPGTISGIDPGELNLISINISDTTDLEDIMNTEGFSRLGTSSIVIDGTRHWGKFTTANEPLLASEGDTGYDLTLKKEVLFDGSVWISSHGDVNASSTLTDNFLIRGDGAEDIDIGNIFMSADGDDLTLPGLLSAGDLTLTPVSGDVDFIINNSSSVEKFNVQFDSVLNQINIDSSVKLVIDSANNILSLNTSGQEMQFQTSGGDFNFLSTGGNFEVTVGTTGSVAFNGTDLIIKPSTSFVGINTFDPFARLDVFEAGEQLRLSHTASSFASFTVDSNGDLVLAPSGGDFSLTGAMSISETLTVGTATNAAKIHVVDIIEQLRLGFDALNFASFTIEAIGFDLTTVNFDSISLGVTTEDSVPTGIVFNSDGTKMYMVGTGTDTVYQYTLTTAFDLSTASFDTVSFSVSSEDTSPQGIRFNTDGTKMYMVGNTNNTVYQYTLGTGFDLSTASFDTVSFSVSSEDTAPVEIAFNSDGTKMYMMGNANATVFQYTLSTGFDLSTASFDSVSFSVTTQESAPESVTFSADGTKMYVVGTNTDTVFQYTLSTAFDLSTASFDSISFSVTTEDTLPVGLILNNSGTKMYVLGISTDTVYQYTLAPTSSSLTIAPSGDEILLDASDVNTSLGKVSVIGGNVIEVFAEEDLGTVDVGVNITAIDGATYLLMAPIIQTLPLDIPVGANVQFLTTNRNANTITYTNTTDAQFRGTDIASLSFFDVVCNGNATGTLFDIDGGLLSLKFPDFENYSDGGTVRNLVDFFCPGTLFEFLDDGLEFIDCTSATVIDGIILSFSGSDINIFKVSGPNSGQLQFYDNILDSDSFANFIRVDPDYASGQHVNVKGNSIVNGSADLFDTTGGTTGTYTAVANNSIAATAVTSVTDNAGIAVFNHAGTSPFLGSTVTLSAFSETTYNVTGIVSATAATTFEVEVQGVGVAFVATDTGSYLMTGVTVTSTAHGLSNGNSLTLASDLSTEYDGGHIIYNVQTNTFDVFETFGATQTGGWNTAGIDQKDPRVLSFDNPGQAETKYIATAFVNDNSTANGAIVNNTFTDMVFGTAGSALVEGTTIERWKLVDELNGTFEYTGEEPYDGAITFDFTVESSGGTVEFRFKWEISTDGGATFVDLPDAVESLVDVASTAQSVTKTFPLASENGDQIRPQITRNSGTSGITTRYATVYATQ